MGHDVINGLVFFRSVGGSFGAATTMQREHRPMQKLLVVSLDPEGERDNHRHYVISFVPTATEQLVLDLLRTEPYFDPGYERGPNAAYALGSYFLVRYPSIAARGDPEDTHKEDNESDDEVAEFIKRRRKERLSQYSWILRESCIGYDDTDLGRGSLDELLQYWKDMLNDKQKIYWKDRVAAEKWRIENPALAQRVLDLDSKRDFPLVRVKERTQKRCESDPAGCDAGGGVGGGVGDSDVKKRKTAAN
jgi:hypothetical protein